MADDSSDLFQTEFDTPSSSEDAPVPKKKSAKKKTTTKSAKKATKKTAKKAVARKKAPARTSSESPETPEAPSAEKKKSPRRVIKRKVAEKADSGNTGDAKTDSKPSIEVVDESPSKAPAKKTAKKAAKKATRKILAVPESMKALKEEPAKEETPEEAPPQRDGRPMGRVKGGPVGKGAERIGRKGDRNQKGENDRRKGKEEGSPRGSKFSGEPFEALGLLETTPKGFGFLREPGRNYEQSRSDIFIPPDLIQQHALRDGQLLKGKAQQGPRGPQLVELLDINGYSIDDARNFPHFDELKAIFPDKRIGLETVPERFTTRVLDILAPVGRGQRGLIVSPPRAGKTTLLLHIAEAVQELHSESLHLMVCLVDERPEEVTEFRRQLPDAEIYASSNDEPPRNHCRLAELCIERAKRLVEAGQDVFLVMDSITRLARAYNNIMGGSKKGRGRGIQSGGIMAGALEEPLRLFAAARNTREAGSLTILGTALVQTNSKADEAIFMEFKGTGNMELVLDRKIAEHFVFPAVDLFKSGTRREELLLPEHSLQKINLIRRGLSGHREIEAMERLLFFLKRFPNNAQMLMEIKG